MIRVALLAACDLIETPSRMARFRMRSGDRSIAFAICSSAFLDFASSSKRRSSLKDQDFRTIAKKIPPQTNCKMSTKAVSRSPKALKGSLKRAPPALGSKPYSGSCGERALAIRHFVNRSSVSSWQSRIAPKAPRDLVTA